MFTLGFLTDTGADYTLLPHYLANTFDIDLETQAQPFTTQGVGGQETVYIVPKQGVLFGDKEVAVPEQPAIGSPYGR